MKFCEADTQAEAVLEHGLQMLEADAVDDVLVHGPALQTVQVLVEPLVPLRQEQQLAVLAPMAGGRAADHLTADASRRELQVVGELGVHLAVQSGDPLSLAAGADIALDLDLPVHRQFRSFLPFPGVQAGSPDRLAGAEEDLLSLIVEVGTAVDVVEILDGELRPTPLPTAGRCRDLVCPGDSGPIRGCLAPFTSAAGCFADSLDELRDLPQGGTVLGVVSEELVFPALLPCLFPASPPHQALQPGGVLFRPCAAEVPAHVL